jgi:hypothetical protein
VAAAGRDPPPDLAVMVNNKRQQAAAGLKRAVAMAGGRRRRAVAMAGGRRRVVAVAESCGYGRGGRRRVVALAEEEEERWVSSAPSWLTESTSPVPKTWSVESPIFWDSSHTRGRGR